MSDTVEFSIHTDKTGKPCYRELTLKSEGDKKIHLNLLDLFFRPRQVLEKNYANIFPPHPEIQDYHSMMITQDDFRPWNGWVFRGQTREHLETTFERRYLKRYLKGEQNRNEQKLDRDLFDLEMGIVRAFKRTAGAFHHELNFVHDLDTYEYMSWIRHFGGATRFMDVTNSFFIALFFAVGRLFSFEDDDCEATTRRCSIWCFDKLWLENRYKEFLPPQIATLYEQHDKFGKDVRIQKAILNYVPDRKRNNEEYNDTFLSVINMEPFYHNRRLIRQKGLFLMPTNPYRSFEDNLFNMVRDEKDAWHILKINIDINCEEAAYLLKFLDFMNINGDVLFENLEGICENLSNKALFHNDSITVSPNTGINNSTSRKLFDI